MTKILGLSDIDFEPLSTLKAKLSEKVAALAAQGRPLVVTVNGKPKAALLSYDGFLELLQKEQYLPRKISLADWEKQGDQRKSVVQSIKKLFDVDSLSRKGQKPYKRDALKKFKKF